MPKFNLTIEAESLEEAEKIAAQIPEGATVAPDLHSQFFDRIPARPAANRKITVGPPNLDDEE